MSTTQRTQGTAATVRALVAVNFHMETIMLRGGLLWLIGIPLPIIIILWFLGYLS
jgi:hypothetical protein